MSLDDASTVPHHDDAAGPALLQGKFEGREDFQQLIRNAFAHAAAQGWKQLILCDATFEDWPLRERSVVDSLQAWAKSGRHLTMVATRYDGIIRNQARFVNWRKTYGHLIDCRQCKAAEPLDFPSALYSPGWVMQRMDLVRSVGYGGAEPQRRVALRELLDEKIRNSSPGFAAPTLGL